MGVRRSARRPSLDVAGTVIESFSIEADLTVTKLAEDKFFIVTAGANRYAMSVNQIADDGSIAAFRTKVKLSFKHEGGV